ncbi:CPC_1213 family protein [Clostridium aromativorans]|nr:CPC_1213 family protein [Clostridium aromativorans]
MHNKIRNNNKKEDGKFKKKHINHDPQAESSRAKFGSPSKKHLD